MARLRNHNARWHRNKLLMVMAIVLLLLGGAVLSLVGMALMISGRIALGRLYNVSSAFGTQLYSDQDLVTSGPFALVRHPMYLAALIAGIGGVLLYRTWAAVLVLTHEVVFWVRAGREDQALAVEFGDTWQSIRHFVGASSGLPGSE